MYKISLTLFLILTTFFLNAQTKDEYLEDLKIYKEIIETAHSGLNLYTSKETFTSLFENAVKGINKTTSQRDFYKTLSSIHTRINCGHSSFHVTSAVTSEIDSMKGCFFPYEVKFLKDTLVLASEDAPVSVGSQILSINGVGVNEIKEQAFKMISSDGYNTTFKYRQLESGFAMNLFLIFGQQEMFEIEVLNYPDRVSKTITIQALKSSELKDEEENQELYNISYFDKETVLLTVNSFSTETSKNQKKFFNFLEENFKQMSEKGIKNLILDIRENTGGNDGNDMELASYLIDRPFKENKYRKLNTLDIPPYPSYLSPYWYNMMGISQKIDKEKLTKKLQKQFKTMFTQGEDSAYYWKENKIIRRDPAKYRFTGNTYILTSGKVFSGGALFSALVRDKSEAIFIGEETGGGYYRHTGSIPLLYQLPNSGILFSIFIVINEQDVDQELVPFGRGTIPHHTIYPTIEEFINGKDPVLDATKNLINKK